ncbi:MAG TPA: Xaa-Pro peptidase family protein [Candidatus Limnocylindrales bacterium]|nr:Xaa-Pro peptidase family protein [Candidatus Limnocylindrales bacterium]
MARDPLLRKKIDQAIALLKEHEIDCWIAQLGQETWLHPDPIQPLVIGTSITWPSAFLITAGGQTIALVGTGDVGNVRQVGAYERVEGYVKDLAPELRRVLDELKPGRIAVSYAASDYGADGITHGWFTKLQAMLKGTPHGARLTSAEPVVSPLRARKLPEEVTRIRQAVRATVEIFEALGGWLRPGVSERDVFDFAHAQMRRRGLLPSWDGAYDPGVNIGAQEFVGHGAPGEQKARAGDLVHVDFGVVVDGFGSDLQRLWYLRRPGESVAPEPIAEAFAAVDASIQAGAEALRPGRQGYEVDAAARQVILDCGFPEPPFALGHMMGRVAHDGAGLLGPRWPRYGTAPEQRVEVNNVFTLEFALQPKDGSGGVVGLEEDVLVTERGAEFLTPPQRELWYL